MTQINRARALAWVALALLAALLPPALVAQVVIHTEEGSSTVNVNVGQLGSPDWGFMHWRAWGVCWAQDRTWRVWSDREGVGAFLLLDRFLQDRTEWADTDWQLSNPSGGSPYSSGVTRSDQSPSLNYDYQAELRYAVGDQSYRSDYRVRAYERDPRNPPDRPYRDTDLDMGRRFVDLVAPETGSPGTDIVLGLDMRFRHPRYDQSGGWRDWSVMSMSLELPTAGLARAIRTAKACASRLPR